MQGLGKHFPLGALVLLGLFTELKLVGQQRSGAAAPLGQPPVGERSPTPARQARANEAFDQAVFQGILKGLRIVRAAPEIVRNPATEGVEVLPSVTNNMSFLRGQDFTNLFTPYLEKEVRYSTLQQMERKVWQYCRKQNHPLVDAIVPADQTFSNGVVQMIVLEGKISNVIVTNPGRAWFSSDFIRSQIHQQVGESFDSRVLDDDIDWLNRNPFRELSPVLTPGRQPTETELKVSVEDRIPLRAYLGFEDTGVETIGVERFVTGFHWGNAFGLDHQFSYQYMADIEFKFLNAHNVTYLAPLPWRHSVQMVGSYVNAESDQFGAARSEGDNYMASLRYGIPLPTIAGLRHQISFGFDFKSISSLLVFNAGTPFAFGTDQSANIAQFQMGYSASLMDPYGQTSLSSDLFVSPGILPDQEDRFSNLRAGTTPTYVYGRIMMERATRLPWDFAWNLQAGIQLASERLLPSEQQGMGGYATVRGYDERQVNGDNGFFVRNELRTRAIPLGTTFKHPNYLQLLGFCDYGITTIIDAIQPFEDPHSTLSSVGVGLRFTLAQNFVLRADYGFQLHEKIELSDRLLSAEHSRAHFSALLSF